MKKVWILAVSACVLGLAIPSVQAAKSAKRSKKNQTTDVFSKYDTNKNGVLDDSEKEAIKKAVETDWSLKAYDTNGDGKLSDDEIAAIKPQAAKGKKGKRK